jgi:hypothetical protein
MHTALLALQVAVPWLARHIPVHRSAEEEDMDHRADRSALDGAGRTAAEAAPGWVLERPWPAAPLQAVP